MVDELNRKVLYLYEIRGNQIRLAAWCAPEGAAENFVECVGVFQKKKFEQKAKMTSGVLKNFAIVTKLYERKVQLQGNKFAIVKFGGFINRILSKRALKILKKLTAEFI